MQRLLKGERVYFVSQFEGIRLFVLAGVGGGLVSYGQHPKVER